MQALLYCRNLRYRDLRTCSEQVQVKSSGQVKILKEGGMTMEGRKPKPTAVKKLEGNPGKRKLNAKEHITSDGSTFETDKGYQQQTPWVGIANTNQKLMLQAASEFGLKPSSRSRIIAGNSKGQEPEDEMEALLGGDS